MMVEQDIHVTINLYLVNLGKRFAREPKLLDNT